MTEAEPRARALVERVAGLSDEEAVRILATIAEARRGRGESVPVWDEGLAEALADEFGVERAAQPVSEGEVARQALMVLALDAETAGPLAAMVARPGPERFDLGAVSGTLLLAGAMMALQAQVEIERDKEGRWRVLVRKEAGKDGAIGPVVRKLVELITRNGE